MSFTKETFEKHLKEEHSLTLFSVYLKEIVYGANDGIVTTFAIVAGFNGARMGELGASLSFAAVLLFGFANLFADAVSMGLGNFLSVRTSKELYAREKNKELYEIRNNPEFERNESIHILKTHGFSEGDAKQLTDIYSKNEFYWLNFMMKDELGMYNPEMQRPFFTALVTFVSFVFFGCLPLLPYALFNEDQPIFLWSIIFTFLSLLLLGFLRGKITRVRKLKAMVEVLLVGVLSAITAYFVGILFRAK